MNIKEIREIIELMKENNLREFEMERDGMRISLKRGLSGEPEMTIVSQPAQKVSAHPQTQEEEKTKEPENTVYIVSPMVGTFYAASSPDASPYMIPGQAVRENDVVCIIEAMKVMNEIKAEIDGKIKEVLVKNGEPVEFGQPMFVVEKK